MERRAHGEQHRLLRALGGGNLNRRLDRALVTGEHDLPVRIVIGGNDDLVIGGFFLRLGDDFLDRTDI